MPVATALLGTALAVTALVATSVFGASLSNLLTTPRLYGVNWQVLLDDLSYPQVRAEAGTLAGDPNVETVTYSVEGKYVKVGDATVPATLVDVAKGPMAFSLVNGHYPTGAGEIALGATTLSQSGAHVGSNIPVTIVAGSGVARTALLTVVGTIAFPPSFGTGGFGIGAVATVRTAETLACPAGPGQRACISTIVKRIENPNNTGWDMAIGTASSAAGRATAARLQREFLSDVAPPGVPNELANFGQAVNFPGLLGATLAIFGAAALLHLLVASVSRRRREVAILKVLGFVRMQVGATVCWQSTTVALVGIVLGVPLGIAAGRVIWRAFAANLGVVPVDVVPLQLVFVFAAGVLVVGNLLALVPAMLAARTRPAEGPAGGIGRLWLCARNPAEPRGCR